MQRAWVSDRLLNPALLASVVAEDQQARRRGFDGAPSFVLGGHFLFSGAQPSGTMVHALRQASAQVRALAAETDRAPRRSNRLRAGRSHLATPSPTIHGTGRRPTPGQKGISAMCQRTPEGSKTKPTFMPQGCSAGGRGCLTAKGVTSLAARAAPTRHRRRGPAFAPSGSRPASAYRSSAGWS